MKKLYIYINYIRFVLHIATFRRFGCESVFWMDFERWRQILRPAQSLNVHTFVDIMIFFPEFRNLFYYRVRKKSIILAKILAFIIKPQPLLSITVENLGGGCFIQHEFATIIAGRTIGKYLWVNQCVTIGYTNATDCPTIGNNVTIGAGAKVIGKVTVGDNRATASKCQ